MHAKKAKNNLSSENLRILYDSQIGGVFAFNENAIIECKEIAKKYGIKSRNLKIIIAQFGSMENFKKAYIQYIISNGKLDESKKIKSCIDLLEGKLV